MIIVLDFDFLWLLLLLMIKNGSFDLKVPFFKFEKSSWKFAKLCIIYYNRYIFYILHILLWK